MEKFINESMINERLLKKSSMINEKKLLCSSEEAEAGAERYVRLLDAPECRSFFLKVMYHLPYPERERIYGAATRSGIGSPKRYFTHSAKRALARIGY